MRVVFKGFGVELQGGKEVLLRILALCDGYWFPFMLERAGLSHLRRSEWKGALLEALEGLPEAKEVAKQALWTLRTRLWLEKERIPFLSETEDPGPVGEFVVVIKEGNWGYLLRSRPMSEAEVFLVVGRISAMGVQRALFGRRGTPARKRPEVKGLSAFEVSRRLYLSYWPPHAFYLPKGRRGSKTQLLVAH